MTSSEVEEICFGYSNFDIPGAIYRLGPYIWSFGWHDDTEVGVFQWSCYLESDTQGITASNCDFYLKDDPYASGKNALYRGSRSMTLKPMLKRLRKDPLAVIMELML